MDYDLSRYAWVGDYEDPNTFLDIWLTNGGNNKTGWGNTVYDRLIEAASDVERFLTAPDFLLEHAHEPEKLRSLSREVKSSTGPSQHLAGMAQLRLALLAEAEGIVVRDEFPVIPLYFYVTDGMFKRNVGGFYPILTGSDGKRRPNLRDMHPLRDLYLKGAP